MLANLIVLIFAGLVVGSIMTKVIKGTGYGLAADIGIGIGGALAAGLLFPTVGMTLGSGIVAQVIIAAIGAVLLLVIIRAVKSAGQW